MKYQKTKLIIFLIFVLSAWPSCNVHREVYLHYKKTAVQERAQDTIVIYKYRSDEERQDTIRY